MHSRERNPLMSLLMGLAGFLHKLLRCTDRCIHLQQAEQQLKTAKDNFQKIFNAAPVGMMIIDENTAITRVNNVVKKLINAEESDVIGQQPGNILSCIHSSDDAQGCGHGPACSDCSIRRTFEQVLHTETAMRDIEAESVLVLDGHEVKLWLNINAETVNIDGKQKVVVALETITQRKQAESNLKEYAEIQSQSNRELKLMQEQITELNRGLEATVAQRTEYIETLLEQKNRFIRQLGHDLKTPLVPLVAGLPLILDSVEDEQNSMRVSRCIDSVNYIHKLVDKTLHFMHASSEEQHLNGEYIDLTKICRDICACWRPVLNDGPLKIVCRLSRAYPVFADPTAVREIVENIISNAVKYSGDADSGQIILEASMGETHVVLTVCDTGIGIDAQQLKHVFEEFYKVDPSRHDRTSAGLGLSICRGLINKLSGRMAIDSKGPGQGTTVTIELPTHETVRIS